MLSNYDVESDESKVNKETNLSTINNMTFVNENGYSNIDLENILNTISIEEIIYLKFNKLIKQIPLDGSVCDLKLLETSLLNVEKSLCKLMIEKTEGNIALASKIFGINRTTLSKKIEHLGLNYQKIRKENKEKKEAHRKKNHN